MRILNYICGMSFFVFLYACAPKGPSVVGVWQPTSLILTDELLKQPDRAKLINQTFDLSKNTYYHFKADNSFALESEKEDPNLKGAVGTYQFDGKSIVINMYNTKLQSDIVKLSETEMQVKSSNEATIVYTKIKD